MERSPCILLLHGFPELAYSWRLPLVEAGFHVVAPDQRGYGRTTGWDPDSELEVYTREFQRTGFQGGLQWYRCAISPGFSTELALFSGRTIDVPSVFISGASDWGHYQRPGALDSIQSAACTRMRGCHFVSGAGHWVQQEQPETVASLLLEFLAAPPL
jgi:pimeloyl-ACP methyl ester carboxylesterase